MYVGISLKLVGIKSKLPTCKLCQSFVSGLNVYYCLLPRCLLLQQFIPGYFVLIAIVFLHGQVDCDCIREAWHALHQYHSFVPIGQ